jgi:phosphinothricin acetyltransferase
MGPPEEIPNAIAQHGGRVVDVTIESMQARDWDAVRAIYQDGIATGQASFEAGAPGREEWASHHRPDCRLVARRAGEVVGWAALSPVSGRCVYGGVAEVSIYVATPARGQGIGTRLLQALVEESEGAGIWTLQAGIFPENVASIKLHRRCGFRTVGRRERLGQMNGVWRDVILMERRSKVVGI